MTGQVSADADDHRYRQGRIDLYESSWKIYLSLANRLRSAGLPMASVVEQFQQASDFAYRHDGGFVPSIIAEQVSRIDLRLFKGLSAPHRLCVADGAYQGTPKSTDFQVMRAAVSAVMDPQVDCLVEFGSGVGLNLARLALHIGPRATPMTYLACEPAPSGLDVTRCLFANGDCRVETHFFDYTDPRLDFLDRFERIVALTCHSIEQIPMLGQNFHRALLARKLAAGIHLEPVGWQRFPNLAAQVRAAHDDPETSRHFCRDYTYVIDKRHLVENTAAWAAACRYNLDLLPQIAALSDEGLITIATLAYEVVGTNNPFNPSTLIVWRPA